MLLPTTRALAEASVAVMTGAYHDDLTERRQPPEPGAVVAARAGAGLAVTEQGIARVPFIDREVAIHARRTGALVSMTLAYWSLSGGCQYLWCRYLVAEPAG